MEVACFIAYDTAWFIRERGNGNVSDDGSREMNRVRGSTCRLSSLFKKVRVQLLILPMSLKKSTETHLIKLVQDVPLQEMLCIVKYFGNRHSDQVCYSFPQAFTPLHNAPLFE